MRVKRPVISGKKGIIASGHYLATQAGLKMYAKGGNAVDAGVAAGLVLTVIKPHENSFGGECPILIYSPNTKSVVAINGQGVAPKKASLEWFQENKINLIPGDGFLGATVPGLPGSYLTAFLEYGTLEIADVFEPAIDLAENGFPMYDGLRECIINNSKRFKEEWPSTAEIYFPDSKLPESGHTLHNPALANLYKEIVRVADCSSRNKAIKKVINHIYKGIVAEKILDFAQNNKIRDASGKEHTTLLEMSDFTDYETFVEKPVSSDYKEYTVYKCGPWTQGPVFLQQLKLLEGFKLNKMEHNSCEYIHSLVECSKLAFNDRNNYYGDPRFVKVPLKMLLSEEYNSMKRGNIDNDKANNTKLWDIKNPETDSDNIFIGDTTHLDTMDREGYIMSATPSGGWIPTSPVIPDLGFPLGTRAQIFDLKKGHPNCLEPGKRPRTTLTPTIAFKNGKPWMGFGTPGGDMQDQWALQFFLNVVEFGMDISTAIEKPAFETRHFTDSFYPKRQEEGVIHIEEGVAINVLYELQQKGHRIFLLPVNTSQVCVVRTNFETGLLECAASSKYDGQAYAAGW